MERERKYRAWDILLNKYRSPGTIQMSLTGKLFILIPNNNSFLVEEIKDLIIEDFTGLKDKNGVDIYEGDIISMSTKKPVAIVEFDYCSFVLKWIDKVYKNTRQKEKEPIFRNIHLFEVVGNIYENPELL